MMFQKWCRKHWTQRAEEQLKGSIILATTFVVIGAVLVGLTHKEQYYNQISNQETPDTVIDALIGWDYLRWNPADGVDITNASVLDKAYGPSYFSGLRGWEHKQPNDAVESAEFYKPGGAADDRDRLRAYVVRGNDNYDEGSSYLDERDQDYILFAQNIGSFWGVKWRFGGISYDTIQTNFKDNVSITALDVGNRNFTIFVTAPTGIIGAENFTNYLWVNNYTMYVGTNANDIDSMGSQGFWKTVGRMLSFQLIDMEEYGAGMAIINLLIGIPFWAMVGFVIVTLISRFIPFIGGG